MYSGHKHRSKEENSVVKLLPPLTHSLATLFTVHNHTPNRSTNDIILNQYMLTMKPAALQFLCPGLTLHNRSAQTSQILHTVTVELLCAMFNMIWRMTSVLILSRFIVALMYSTDIPPLCT